MYIDCTQAASSAETQTDFSYCICLSLKCCSRSGWNALHWKGSLEKKTSSLLDIDKWNELLMPFPQIINLYSS